MATRVLHVAPVGALLPLLAVAGATSLLHSRESLNAPLAISKSSSTDCVSTAALQLCRGLGAGLAWTISADGYAMTNITETEWKNYMATRPNSSIARETAKTLARHSVRNMLGFAGFLCIFSSISCSMEKLRNTSDLLNPFTGGFSAALIILSGELRKTPRYHWGVALVCGVGSMGLHYFIPTTDSKNEDENRKFIQ